MKKAKPARSNKPTTTVKKRSPARKRGFPLQLFFSFYTAMVRQINYFAESLRLSPPLPAAL